jgi:hypothetical protein
VDFYRLSFSTLLVLYSTVAAPIQAAEAFQPQFDQVLRNIGLHWPPEVTASNDPSCEQLLWPKGSQEWPFIDFPSWAPNEHKVAFAIDGVYPKKDKASAPKQNRILIASFDPTGAQINIESINPPPDLVSGRTAKDTLFVDHLYFLTSKTLIVGFGYLDDHADHSLKSIRKVLRLYDLETKSFHSVEDIHRSLNIGMVTDTKVVAPGLYLTSWKSFDPRSDTVSIHRQLFRFIAKNEREYLVDMILGNANMADGLKLMDLRRDTDDWRVFGDPRSGEYLIDVPLTQNQDFLKLERFQLTREGPPRLSAIPKEAKNHSISQPLRQLSPRHDQQTFDHTALQHLTSVLDGHLFFLEADANQAAGWYFRSRSNRLYLLTEQIDSKIEVDGTYINVYEFHLRVNQLRLSTSRIHIGQLK